MKYNALKPTGVCMFLALILLLVSQAAVSQSTNDPNYFSELAERQSEMNTLEQILTEEELNREGGPRVKHEVWKRTWGPRADENGSYAQYYLNTQQALEQIQNMEVVSAEAWQELGPTEHPNSNLMTTVGGGDFGPGPIEFIQFYDSQPNLVLCGSTSGGLYVSYNAGVSWENAGTDQGWEISGCGWAEFRSGHPDTWFAVNAGQGSTGQEDIGLGALWRTTDSGVNWSKILDHAAIGSYTTVFKFKVNPTNTNNMVVATEKGVFVSDNINELVATDVSWQQLEFPLGGTDDRSVVFDLEYIPNDGFYATLCDNSFSNFTIIHSPTGLAWEEISNQPTDLANHWRVTLSVSNSNNNVLTVLGVQTNGLPSSHKLYQVNLTSLVWSTLAVPNENIAHGSGKAFCISHHNLDHVMMGTGVNYLRYTTDGGQSWSLNNAGVGDLWHVDLEDVVSHPTNPNEFWIATHGGVYRSVNGGLTFARRSSGLGVGQVWSISSESKDLTSQILISRYHGGSSQLKSESIGWLTVADGDGQVSLVSDLDPQFQYAANQWGSWQGTNDAWDTRTPQYGFLQDGSPHWQSEGEIDSHNPLVVYHSSHGNEIKRTLNGGLSSEYITDFDSYYSQFPNTSFNSGAAGVLHSSLARRGLLYSATKYTEQGNNRIGLLRTTISEHSNPATVISSWEDVPLPNFDEVNWGIAGIAADPENEYILYIAKAKGVDVTGSSANSQLVYIINQSLPPTHPDYAKDITFNLPRVLVRGRNGIIYERGSNGGLYLTSELGVVFYTNRGFLENDPEPWKIFGSDIPHVTIMEVDIDYGVNKVRIATSGRGVWEHDLYCPYDQDLVLTGNLVSDEFYEASSTISSTESIGSGISSSYRAGFEIVLNPGFTAVEGSNWRGFIHGCETQGNSFRLADPNQNENETNGFSTNESASSQNMTVYPNPNTGSFTIAGSSLQQVIITDATGKLIKQLNGGLRSSLEVDGLSAGLYLVRAQMADGRLENAKVVVQ